MTERTPERTFTEGLCALLFLLGLPAWILWAAFVDVQLWAWFAVPLGAPPLALLHAAGLGVLIRAHTSRVRRKQPKTSAVLFSAILAPLTYLALGWLIHHFMVAH